MNTVQPGKEILPSDGSALLFDSVLDTQCDEDVFAAVLNEVPWESRTITVFGRQHVEPRLTAWFGDEGASYSYSGIQLSPRTWTPTLLNLRALCEEYAGTQFNSVLLNLYRDGNDKMGWHADNERELGTEPVIASLSLGATRRFRFRHRATKNVVACELVHGSLLVMRGLTQTFWVHEVPRQKRITEPRINLTFRYIHRR